jgi:hypothetical protein
VKDRWITTEPSSRAEAYAMLAQAALSDLWSDSDFQPDGMGCCHVCCAPCAALHYLDGQGVLEALLAEWPDGCEGSYLFPDGRRLDREWMHRQWSGSRSQEQCGHRLDNPEEKPDA